MGAGKEEYQKTIEHEKDSPKEAKTSQVRERDWEKAEDVERNTGEHMVVWKFGVCKHGKPGRK